MHGDFSFPCSLKFDSQQIIENPGSQEDNHLPAQAHGDHGHAFSTWSYESDQPFSIEALRLMVKRELPASIYRCKGIIYAADNPDRRMVLQVVGRRADVSLDEEWGDRQPHTQIVAIGTPGGINEKELTGQFNACIRKN